MEQANQSHGATMLGSVEFLIALFSGPEESRCMALLDQGGRELVALCPPDSPLAEPIQRLAETLPAPEELPALCRELQTEHVRLFISNPGGVPAPLYASCHQSSPSALMSDTAREMAKRLRDAGLEPDLPGNEPADHLCIELGYLAHLLVSGWEHATFDSSKTPESLESPEAARLFAKEHLHPWVVRFAGAVGEAQAPALYLRAVELLQTVTALAAGAP